ncbi:uncharacterized protein LOC144444655 isoform X2 [Glandiceps talaboti]
MTTIVNMNSLPLVFLVFALYCGSSMVQTRSVFSWKPCGGNAGSDVTFSKLSLTPSPIKLPGTVEFGYDMTIHQLEKGAKIKVDMKKIGWLKIPVRCKNDFGSCTYDFCYLIEDFLGDHWCSSDQSIVCDCPSTGRYQGNISIDLPSPNISSFLKLFVDGKYEATIHILHADGKEAGCLKTTMFVDM